MKSLDEALSDSSRRVRLSPWYLNTRRITAATDVDIGVEAQLSITQNSADRAEQMRLAMRLAQNMVNSGDIPNLNQAIIADRRPSERIFASTWAVFTFRGLTSSVLAEQKGKKAEVATFSGDLPLGDAVYKASEHF